MLNIFGMPSLKKSSKFCLLFRDQIVIQNAITYNKFNLK